jgi:hypothetical protein
LRFLDDASLSPSLAVWRVILSIWSKRSSVATCLTSTTVRSHRHCYYVLLPPSLHPQQENNLRERGAEKILVGTLVFARSIESSSADRRRPSSVPITIYRSITISRCPTIPNMHKKQSRHSHSHPVTLNTVLEPDAHNLLARLVEDSSVASQINRFLRLVRP